MADSLLSSIDPALVAELLASDPAWARAAELYTESAFFTFTPRPDRPDLFDEQTSFVGAKDYVSFALGGNGSGKTAAAAAKCARFVLHEQPPPRRDTPFWIIAASYEQVCSVCWGEKLHGMQFIPRCEVDWSRISWLDAKLGWPKAVPLKPWPGRPGKNWMLQFKSYEQGREQMQAASIGGFWFSEQFPWGLFIEVLRGTRDYSFPGGQFCEFTPIEPELCIWIEKLMDDPPPGYRFYRLNTWQNASNLAGGWVENFAAAVPEELAATRLTGALATFEGVIYQAFNPRVHVVGDDVITFPPGVYHHRGIDWGASEEHPQTCVWGYRDGMGDWFIYDEYWNNSQSAITRDHAVEIVARSICWGWPEPDWFGNPLAEMDSDLPSFRDDVRRRVAEIAGERGIAPRYRNDQHHGMSWGDPARPGEINQFNRFGVAVHPAINDVYKGINEVRKLLKVHPITGKPRLYIHQRCKHLIEEHRKYRWLKGRKPSEGSYLNPKAPRPIPMKRDDDTVDAERYMIASEASSRGIEPGSASSRPAQREHSGAVVPLRRGGDRSNAAVGVGSFTRTR